MELSRKFRNAPNKGQRQRCVCTSSLDAAVLCTAIGTLVVATKRHREELHSSRLPETSGRSGEVVRNRLVRCLILCLVRLESTMQISYNTRPLSSQSGEGSDVKPSATTYCVPHLLGLTLCLSLARVVFFVSKLRMTPVGSAQTVHVLVGAVPLFVQDTS